MEPAPLLFEVFAILRDAHGRLPAPIAAELSRSMELLHDFEELAEQILDIRALKDLDESNPVDHADIRAAFGYRIDDDVLLVMVLRVRPRGGAYG